jgi:hypothetical protein
MTAWILDRKLVTLTMLVAVTGAAILYAIWIGWRGPDYSVDSAQYLKDVAAQRPIDTAIPSVPLAPRTSAVAPASPAPRGPLPTDQEVPTRGAIVWNAPTPAYTLPDIKTPEIKNLTGFDKIPELSAAIPDGPVSIPTVPVEQPGTTFRLILPGSSTTGSTALPSSIPGGVIGTAGGLLKH